MLLVYTDPYAYPIAKVFLKIFSLAFFGLIFFLFSSLLPCSRTAGKKSILLKWPYTAPIPGGQKNKGKNLGSVSRTFPRHPKIGHSRPNFDPKIHVGFVFTHRFPLRFIFRTTPTLVSYIHLQIQRTCLVEQEKCTPVSSFVHSIVTTLLPSFSPSSPSSSFSPLLYFVFILQVITRPVHLFVSAFVVHVSLCHIIGAQVSPPQRSWTRVPAHINTAGFPSCPVATFFHDSFYNIYPVFVRPAHLQ